MRKTLWMPMLVLLAAFALYSLAGFLLAPHFVKRWLQSTVATDVGQRLDIEGVALNPYTFALSLIHVTLIRQESPVRVSADRIDASVDVRSIVGGFWLFRNAVEFTGVEIRSRVGVSPTFTADKLSATDVVVDTDRSLAMIERLHVDKPFLRIERHARGDSLLPPWLHRLALETGDPVITIGRVDLTEGRVVFQDPTVSPAVTIESDGIDAQLSREPPGAPVRKTMSLIGRIPGPGVAEVRAEWRSPTSEEPSLLHIDVSALDLAVVSPYIARFAGRAVATGRANLVADMQRAAASVEVENRLVAEGVRLGARIDDPSAGDLALDLGVALLQDTAGKLRHASRKRFEAANAASGAAAMFAASWRDAVEQLTAAPFDVMADVAGWQKDSLDRLAFEHGSADVSPRAEEKLAAIATALTERPLLGLTVRPRYDPVADRDALARKQLRLHVTLATSAGPPGRADDEPIDVGDARVRDILDEFAATRLSENRRRAVTTRFPTANDSYYEAVFDALVENQPVAESALRRLARYRSQSVVNALVRGGVDADRLRLAEDIEVLQDPGDAIEISLSAWADHSDT